MAAAADSVEEFVVETIAGFAHCRREDVKAETSLIDLGIDSLAVATLATFVEAEFGCTFTPAQLTTLYSATRVEEVVVAITQVACSGPDRGVSRTPLAEQAL